MTDDQKQKLENGVINFIKKNIGLLFIAIFGLFIFSGAFFTVNSGEKAVILQFGAVDRIASEGLHFKIPFIEQRQIYSTRIQKFETTDAVAGSKDLQVVHTNLSINYAINGNNLKWIYTNLRDDFTVSIIEPRVNDIFKAVTAKYNAEELITKRESVKSNIEDLIKKDLKKYSILVDNVAITNFKFSKEFDNAIEAKQVAEQEALTAKNQLDRIKVEAEQKIASAQAEAEALRLQKQEITPDLIKLRAIEVQNRWIAKWDGKTPTTVLSDSVMPTFNVR